MGAELLVIRGRNGHAPHAVGADIALTVERSANLSCGEDGLAAIAAVGYVPDLRSDEDEPLRWDEIGIGVQIRSVGVDIGDMADDSRVLQIVRPIHFDPQPSSFFWSLRRAWISATSLAMAFWFF